VDDLLTRLRLTALAQANPYTLSGGEQRRLSVATALAAAPRVLVLDEPTFGQDRRTWLELVDLLAKLRDDGTAVVVVTHDVDFVEVLADRRLRPGPAMSFAAPIARPGAPLARRNPVAKLLGGLGLTFLLLSTLDPVAPAVALGGGTGGRTLVRHPLPRPRPAGLAAVARCGRHPRLAAAVRHRPVRVRPHRPRSMERHDRAAVERARVRVAPDRGRAARDPDLRQHGSDRPGRRAGPERQGAAAVRHRHPGRVPVAAAARAGMAHAEPGPPARGVDAGRNPFAAGRLFASTMFGLLVGAIRRGTRLATAMDARGFDSTVPRTVARRQRFTGADVLFVVGALAVGAVAVGVSLALGTFQPLLA
jgi:hypothetical protein